MTIGPFTGQYRWLSNFWPAPVEMDGRTYATVEHAYVASKTTDESIREEIRAVHGPGSIKQFGRRIQLRPDWEEIKLSVMEDLVRKKFKHVELATKLLTTGDEEIVEVNFWGDTFWGVCQGEGENHLGRILMKIRAEILAKIKEGKSS